MINKPFLLSFRQGDNGEQTPSRRINETTKDVTARRRRRDTAVQLTDTRPPIIVSRYESFKTSQIFK